MPPLLHLWLESKIVAFRVFSRRTTAVFRAHDSSRLGLRRFGFRVFGFVCAARTANRVKMLRCPWGRLTVSDVTSPGSRPDVQRWHVRLSARLAREILIIQYAASLAFFVQKALYAWSVPHSQSQSGKKSE